MAQQVLKLIKPLPLGLTTPLGFNFAWIVTHLGNATQGNFGGGYQFGFTSQWDEIDIYNQLLLLQQSGVKYVRIWLTMSNYITTDSNGFVSFNPTFLANLDTLINVIFPSLGLKAYVCMEDNYYTFQYSWLATQNSAQWNNYIKQYTTLFSRYANNPNIWGWDYFNEGVVAGGNPLSHATMLAFFSAVYNAGKAVSPIHYFSVGQRNSGDSYLDPCCDMFDWHQYDDTGNVNTIVSNQPIVFTEFGGNVGEGVLGANTPVVQ